MGLAEHIRRGANLTRQLITLTTDATRSGSVDLGSAYMLLGIQSTLPCRIRLYDNQTSRDTVSEISRSFGSTNIPENIALVADFVISQSNTYYTLDPVLYGCAETSSNKLSYYRIDDNFSMSHPQITFNRYLLEDSSVGADLRKTFVPIQRAVTSNTFVTGTLANVDISRTYLLVSASVSGSNVITRLRLYSSTGSLTNQTEISRSFSTEPSASAGLIVDAILSGSKTTYFVPKIVGANLQTMGTNLQSIARSNSLIMGNTELYYILENKSVSPGTVSVTASLHVLELEGN